MASSKNKLSKVQRLACLGITGAFRSTPTGAVEALVGLDMVIQGEAKSAARRLWCLGAGVVLTFTQNEDIVAH